MSNPTLTKKGSRAGALADLLDTLGELVLSAAEERGDGHLAHFAEAMIEARDLLDGDGRHDDRALTIEEASGRAGKAFQSDRPASACPLCVVGKAMVGLPVAPTGGNVYVPGVEAS